MSIAAPEVVVEAIINQGLDFVIANADTAVPLILTAFPDDYIADTIAYLKDTKFDPQVVFQYAYNPAKMPVFNIILHGESEHSGNSQMFLGDIVQRVIRPATDANEEDATGSHWSCSVSVVIRAEKMRQLLVLYTMLKWIMLNNRETFESAGIMTPKLSGSDPRYDPTQPPTQIFSRTLTIDMRTENTVDTPLDDIGSGNNIVINTVIGAHPPEVRDL